MLHNIFKENVTVKQNPYKLKLESSLDDEDIFDNFYNMLMMEEAKMSEEVVKMYRYFYLAESTGDYEIVNESFGSFCDKAAEFFKKLGDSFKEHFGKAYTLIMIGMGKGAQYFADNKDVILSKNVTFSLQGNVYTYKDGIPNLSKVDDLIKDYNNEMSKIKSMKVQEILTRREKFVYDIPKLKGELLGSDKKIPEGEFAEHCKKFFRNGESDTVTIDINQNAMRALVDRMPEAKKELNSYKKEADKIKEQLHALVKYFEDFKVRWKEDDKQVTLHQLERKEDRVSKVDDTEVSYSVSSSDGFKLLNTYLSFRELEAKTLETSYITIINEKMRALKDETEFHKKVMTKWTTTPEKGPDVASAVEKEVNK